MKSSQQLSQQLAKQWYSADYREQRLLQSFDWPLRLAIGKPSAKIFISQSLQVRQHLADWRKQKVGRVEWQATRYQSASEPVEVPTAWLIDSPDEWIAAAAVGVHQVIKEFKQLKDIVQQIAPIFHKLIVRRRSLWVNKKASEIKLIIRSCQLALLLQPGMAMGRPLRALSIEGFDTKFLEKQRGLLSLLINIRFAGILGGQTLEEFLAASEKGEHWLLLKPLAQGLLPFEQLRLRASELAQIDLPVKNLIIVENEQCLFQLPTVENTLAILGSGLNLNWLKNPNFKNKTIVYWGDIDTWGLKMLAIARNYYPQLQTMLMDIESYCNHEHLAVPEPTNAGMGLPQGLTTEEAKLYQILIQSTNGRLEQERLPASVVQTKLLSVFS